MAHCGITGAAHQYTAHAIEPQGWSNMLMRMAGGAEGTGTPTTALTKTPAKAPTTRKPAAVPVDKPAIPNIDVDAELQLAKDAGAFYWDQGGHQYPIERVRSGDRAVNAREMHDFLAGLSDDSFEMSQQRQPNQAARDAVAALRALKPSGWNARSAARQLRDAGGKLQDRFGLVGFVLGAVPTGAFAGVKEGVALAQMADTDIDAYVARLDDDDDFDELVKLQPNEAARKALARIRA